MRSSAILITLATAGLLAACGQKGPLYLPEPTPAARGAGGPLDPGDEATGTDDAAGDALPRGSRDEGTGAQDGASGRDGASLPRRSRTHTGRP